jgi:hypothetical protein
MTKGAGQILQKKRQARLAFFFVVKIRFSLP